MFTRSASASACAPAVNVEAGSGRRLFPATALLASDEISKALCENPGALLIPIPIAENFPNERLAVLAEPRLSQRCSSSFVDNDLAVFVVNEGMISKAPAGANVLFEVSLILDEGLLDIVLVHGVAVLCCNREAHRDLRPVGRRGVGLCEVRLVRLTESLDAATRLSLA